MTKLNSPYEIFDLGDSESAELRVVGTETGEIDIHPQYGEKVKVVVALRLHLKDPWKPNLMPYIDVTSQRLRAILGGYLQNLGPVGTHLKITKYGQAPKAVFSVEVLP